MTVTDIDPQASLLDLIGTQPEPAPAPAEPASEPEPVEPTYLSPAHAPTLTDNEDLEAKFWEWFHANPGLFDEIIRRSEQIKAMGRGRISMKGLFESIRYSHLTGEIHADADGWSLNNNYTSLMARLLRIRRPDLGELFETRERHTA